MFTTIEEFYYTFHSSRSSFDFTCHFKFQKQDARTIHLTPEYERQIIKIREFLITLAEHLEIHRLELTALYQPEYFRWMLTLEYIGFKRYKLDIALSICEIELRPDCELLRLAEYYATNSLYQFREAMANYPQEWCLNTRTKIVTIKNPCAFAALEVKEINFLRSRNNIHDCLELVLRPCRRLNMKNSKLWYERLLPLQCSRIRDYKISLSDCFYVITPSIREIIREGDEYIIDTSSEEWGVALNCVGTPYEASAQESFFARNLRALSYTPTYEPKPKHIGDITCSNNARSEFLRCAINPSGPCEGCKDYTNRKK